MPRRPNYRQERSERNRNKEARKLEKLQRKNEESERRKALKVDGAPTGEAEAEERRQKPEAHSED